MVTRQSAIGQFELVQLVSLKFGLVGQTIEFVEKVIEIFKDCTQKLLEKNNQVGYIGGVKNTRCVEILYEIAKANNWNVIQSIHELNEEQYEKAIEITMKFLEK